MQTLMFIIAQDSSGNVTLSVRMAQYSSRLKRTNRRDYNEPIIIKNVTATLLGGTGVQNGYIQANFHVTNGMSWQGGILDKTSNNQNFVWAFSPNAPSGGASGNLIQHVSVGGFQLDLTQAIGAGGIPIVVSPSTSWGWSNTVIAHAVIMGLAWVGALPAGAVIIRFLNERIPNPVAIHQLVQLGAFFFVFIAFWIGVGASKGQHFKFSHQWLGLLLFLGLICQAAVGFYHHRRFKEEKPTSRRWFTHLHLWFGRSLLFLALINIGLGIQLYGNGAGAQAGWYLFTIALVAGYAFAYWHQFIRQKRRRLDTFDPTPLEAGDDNSAKTYESLHVNQEVMTENDLGTYRGDYYDPPSGQTDPSHLQSVPNPTITAVGRPTTASRSQIGRRYDIPTPLVAGPYPTTEPLRTSFHGDPQIDPFAEPQQMRPLTGARPMTGVAGGRPPTGRPPTGRPPTGRPRTNATYQTATGSEWDLLAPYDQREF